MGETGTEHRNTPKMRGLLQERSAPPRRLPDGLSLFHPQDRRCPASAEHRPPPHTSVRRNLACIVGRSRNLAILRRPLPSWPRGFRRESWPRLLPCREFRCGVAASCCCIWRQNWPMLCGTLQHVSAVVPEHGVVNSGRRLYIRVCWLGQCRPKFGTEQPHVVSIRPNMIWSRQQFGVYSTNFGMS